MSGYTINKGVGKPVEFKGLRSQYFIYAVVGTVISVVLFFIFSFIVGQSVAVIISVVFFVISISGCYYLNNRFGEYGLTQYYARKATPKRIVVGRRIYKILSVKDIDKIGEY